MRILTLLLSCFIIDIGLMSAQDQVVIGDDGIMRWRKDNKEITGFGVNYTVPFAHAYRSGKKLGVNLKEAIDQDVYHFARLGLDLFRVHVWDTEISDTLGNLLDNEHLELFDYLLLKLQERNIRSVITPIAYWGNGWPDRDEPTPGFSHKYGKSACLTDTNAIRAQENYLTQFVSHINRYTGKSYKDDPQILAFEVCNEPHHRGTPEEVTLFVSKMVNAIRSTGTTKPVFYNVTHSVHLADAYFDGGIDGGTFQWYPTGLGFQKELQGNMLPNVDKYEIPFEDVLKENGAARFVYEFDAADMGTSYMYPAMARSFRTAGMQLATHFSYDPIYLAPYNTEYNTHYMNLAYAPQKALSLMICAEVFRTIPLYKDYGVYPDNAKFGPFRVSYEENLAEMLTDEKFIYTNHTSSKIPHPEKLKLIAGYGNSALVNYEGRGAYFLDKFAEGIWRLEVFPDPLWINNLFGRNSLDQKVAVIMPHERRKMKINLPEFEHGYFIESVDWRDSIIYREVRDEAVMLKPGVYLLMAPEYDQENTVELNSMPSIRLDEFFVPPGVEDGNLVVQARHKQIYQRSLPPKSSSPILLFDAAEDSSYVNRTWIRGTKLNRDESGTSLYLPIRGLVRTDEENPLAKPIADYSLRYYFGEKTALRSRDLQDKKELVLHASSLNDTFPVRVALVMRDGSAFGSLITLRPDQYRYSVDLADLQRVDAVLLPRPYPTFLPYYSSAGKADALDISLIESLQISVGPGIDEKDWGRTFELNIGRVLLE